ncbi:MAG: glycosyltransferase family 39 protein [Alphaproteobacteria bacterium]|nr:glycosyltransferase family 39 protein [Alphaproteobacteria bacterium]
MTLLTRQNLFLAIAGLTVLRLATLAASPLDLFPDEAQYWDWSRELAWGYFSKPPLVGWVIHASTAVCGDGPACIRASSPLLHALGALFVYLAARRFFNEETGLWSGLVYLTLPGIFFSSGFVSTDVPLLTMLAGALWALARYREDAGWGNAALLGLFFGIAFLAKYAALFALGGLILWALLTREGRGVFLRLPTVAAAGSFLAVIANNILWNRENGFITVSHTADNANWGAELLNPGKALEFFGAQFGVFGPILLISLFALTVRAIRRRDVPGVVVLFLAMSVPVVLGITGQALVSRAHANWAASAYVAATPAVVWFLLEGGRRKWLAGSVILHSVVGLGLYVFTLGANSWSLIPGVDPFHRVVAWQQTADTVKRVIATQGPFDVLLSDDRRLTAALVYELRDYEGRDGPPLRMWHRDGPPPNHYAIDRPYVPQAGERVLFVNRFGFPDGIATQFAEAEKIAEAAIPIRPWRDRTLHFSILEDPNAP